ncbi:MAG: chemotaxis protein CheA [Methanobacteriota archaeon]|nr:MAG: chemotaxis protein CheA [Euryarchaeota archaeon]
MDEYRDIFIAELEENIKLLSDSLLKLEKAPSQLQPLEDVIRAAHTVKGMAATMGFDNLTRLTHTVESKLREIQAQGRISKNLVSYLFQVVDRLEQFLHTMQDNGDLGKIQVDDLVRFLEDFNLQADLELEQEGAGAEPILRLENKFSIKVKFKRGAKLIGARGFQLLRAVESIAQVIDSNPPRPDIEEGKLLGDLTLEIITNEDELSLREVISKIEDVDEITISRLVEQDTGPRVKVRRGIQTVRVNLDQLDDVVDLLGELVLNRGRLEAILGDIINPEIVENLNTFDALITSIQDKLMKMRMVPLGRIFENYPRTVRDIASKRGQEINIFIQGSHIELDRSVIDQVNEALLHLVRNAATHGIEDKKTRKKLGKPEAGTIRVSAFQDKGEVQIIVEDDGSGLNLEKIRKKGIEMGLITEETKLTRSQVAALIFHPGFSTADVLSEAAGRGVGMDIVKETINEISGSIEIRSKANVGTQFIIRVPQTLAIIEALIVQVNEFRFALPMLNIEKIYPEDDPDLEYHEEEVFLKFGKYTIPVIDLESSLIIPTHIKPMAIPRRGKKQKKKVILWEKGGRRVAFKVTNVLEQREIVTKQFDVVLADYPGFSGATILKEEEVVLILDPATFHELVLEA